MTLLNESRAVDLQIRWAELALESAQLQYDIAVSESSDGVLTESENEYLFMEAEEAAKKSKNIILRAIEKVIEFIKSAIAKISKAFSDKKIKKDLEYVKKIQNDPDVRNIKVEIPDYKEFDKNIKEFENTIDIAEKKAKSGKLTQDDIDKMNDAKKKCSTKKKMIVVGAASGALALGGLVIASKATLNKMENELTECNDKYSKIIINATNGYDKRTEKYLTDVESGEMTATEAINKVSNAAAWMGISGSRAVLNKSKADLQILYGTLWRRCMTPLLKFGIDPEDRNTYDKDKISQRIDNANTTISNAKELQRKAIGNIVDAKSGMAPKFSHEEMDESRHNMVDSYKNLLNNYH